MLYEGGFRSFQRFLTIFLQRGTCAEMINTASTLNKMHFLYSIVHVMLCSLTIPCIKHVCDEVVYKGNLGLWDATRVPVKHRHNHW